MYLCRKASAVKKILIIRLSSIGDIVLTTPLLRCVKQKYPEAELHLLTKKGFASLLEPNPYVDKIINYEKNSDELLSFLKNEKYDFVADLHRNIRSRRIVRALKTSSATFPKLNIRKWLLVNFKWNCMPDIHIVERYFQAVEPIGVKNDNKEADFFISEKATKEAQLFIPENNSPFVALAVGAAHFTKQIPEDLAHNFAKKTDFPILLLGSKNDFEKGEEIKKELKNVVNLCGKLSVHGSAAIIKQAAVVISADTGMMHIAAALKKPIISIWGNTVPAFGMYPYLPNNLEKSIIVEHKNLTCRPCSKIGFQKCPKKHFKCMEELDATLITDAVSSFL